MNIIKPILLTIIGIFGTYVLFRVIVLAIAKSWKQVMHPDIKKTMQITDNDNRERRIANNDRERRKENRNHEE